MVSLHEVLNSTECSPPLSQSVVPKQHGLHYSSEPGKAQNYNNSLLTLTT